MGAGTRLLVWAPEPGYWFGRQNQATGLGAGTSLLVRGGPEPEVRPKNFQTNEWETGPRLMLLLPLIILSVLSLTKLSRVSLKAETFHLVNTTSVEEPPYFGSSGSGESG